MEIRKIKQVEDILDFVKSKWKLNIVEEDVLNSVLTLFAQQDIQKIKQIEHLLNNENDDLLDSLGESVITRYAVRELNLIDSNDEMDLVEALKKLNYNFIENVDEDEMIDYLEDNGYEVLVKEDSDILSDCQKEELNDYFESLSFLERAELLNKIKK